MECKETERKENILDAWIMVERLSEGDINLKDKMLTTFGELQNADYYELFLGEMRRKKTEQYKKSGIVLYFDIFHFKEVADFLRTKYHLKPEEEITYNHKFSFALCFDKSLKMQSEMTFLTESYYIRRYKKIPQKSEFSEFEADFKKRFEEMFTYTGDDYKAHFNGVIASVLHKNKIAVRDCRMKAVRNLETDVANLHSFFAGDLEKAKKNILRCAGRLYFRKVFQTYQSGQQAANRWR